MGVPLVSSALFAACSEVQPPSAKAISSPAPNTGARVSPAQDLGAAAAEARIAWQPEEGRLVGMGASHRVVSDGAGISLFPVAPPRTRGAKPELGAALHLDSPQVTRGARHASAETNAPVRIEKARIVVARGDFEERLDNREDGVEISYSFARAPEGEGDLTIKVDVTGQKFVDRTVTGLHWVDDATGLGVRFGNATWIDATGKKTRVSMRAKDGEVVMRVPERVLVASTYPAVLDPLVSPEHEADAPIAGLGSGVRRDELRHRLLRRQRQLPMHGRIRLARRPSRIAEPVQSWAMLRLQRHLERRGSIRRRATSSTRAGSTSPGPTTTCSI